VCVGNQIMVAPPLIVQWSIGEYIGKTCAVHAIQEIRASVRLSERKRESESTKAKSRLNCGGLSGRKCVPGIGCCCNPKKDFICN